jgi:hypothetical protein
VAQYQAEQLLTQRDKVSSAVKSELTKRAAEFNILIDDVAITHLSFGTEFTKAVESKQVAQQEAERSKFVVMLAEQEKQAAVILAEGESQAAQLISQALREGGTGMIEVKRIDAAREIARQCLLDWCGVALVGAREPLVMILKDQAAEDGGSGAASLVGGGPPVSFRQAALINGAAGHAIDYDDTHLAAHGHVTASVMPAALAAAEARRAGGDALLRAFAAGFEMCGRVGQI